MTRWFIFGLVLVLSACADSTIIPLDREFSVPTLSNESSLDPLVREQYRERHRILDQVLASERVSDADKAQAYGQLGKIYHAYQRRDEARSLYRAAHLMDPGEARWAHLLGAAERAVGRLPASDAAFAAALKLRPGDAALHVYLGQNGLDQGQLEDARGHFEAALLTDPRCARARLGLGRVAMAEGRFEAAIEQLEMARDESQGSEILYLLSTAYRQVGQGETAASLLDLVDTSYLRRSSVKLRDPLLAEIQGLRRDANHYEHEGLKAIGRGDLRQAASDLRRAIAMNSERLEARHNLALVLVRLGRRDQAIEELRQVVKIDPGFAPSHLSLARFLHQEGELEKAEAHYRQALTLDPDSTEAQQGLAELFAKAPR